MRALPTPITALVLSLLMGVMPARATTHTVVQIGFAFDPIYLSIVAGDTVRWVWTNAGLHTVTSGYGSQDPTSGDLFNGIISAYKPSFEFVFTEPDTVRYYCIPHEELDMVGWVFVETPTGVSAKPPSVAPILRTYPNPFASRAVIAYTLPAASPVDLRIYDARGRLVATLEEGWRPGGGHRATWDGRDTRGGPVPSGVYFCRLETATGAITRRLVLLR
ncbi:MAG: T9SS type A sorting domain-containing protein [Candidatus Krumholzibacteria bacterium]|nr:T9SS type A sorting domain-containing protein [Candidatus Krumholzibacteria bacterium]